MTGTGKNPANWEAIDRSISEARATVENRIDKLRKQTREVFFNFEPFSEKQKKVLSWWCPSSPVKNYNGIIADGSIRSGKTLSMSLAYVIWAMTSFDGQNFALCGKTIGSLRRNVLFWLRLMLRSRGYTVQDRRADNCLVVRRGGVINYFYCFGGKDERSQDLIQGITLAGALFDEVALMPESFVNQATARCSVKGSKWWFNCNPEGPQHWFYNNWILKRGPKELLYLHFTMEDNLSLSPEIKTRYKRQYSGVFYDRFILGFWVVAQGAVYRIFTERKSSFYTDRADFDFIQIGVDFGGNKSAHAFCATGLKSDYSKLTVLMTERHPATGLTPDDLYTLFEDFVEKVRAKYGAAAVIFADSAEQTLINGIKARIPIPVKNSRKNPIIDRIRGTTSLMASGRFFMTRDCASLEAAFETAVYNDKKMDDERLDDGSSDIDSLDAFEYSWERYLRSYERYRNHV